jgi:hypothetical protein
MNSLKINVSYLAAGTFAHLLHNGQNTFHDPEQILDELVSYFKLKHYSIFNYQKSISHFSKLS